MTTIEPFAYIVDISSNSSGLTEISTVKAPRHRPGCVVPIYSEAQVKDLEARLEDALLSAGNGSYSEEQVRQRLTPKGLVWEFYGEGVYESYDTRTPISRYEIWRLNRNTRRFTLAIFTSSGATEQEKHWDRYETIEEAKAVAEKDYLERVRSLYE